MSKPSDEPSGLQVGTQDLQRTTHANEFYLSICEESGLPIVSWHNFDSWKE